MPYLPECAADRQRRLTGARRLTLSQRLRCFFDPVYSLAKLLSMVASRHGGRSGCTEAYESDPFELSNEELQRLLDAAQPPRSRRTPSPFKD
ncbi:MAG: hypothetical protein Q8Q85_07295 [Gemmatimonadales bacterium]|nr:hypothetical protein [Gemmatimonadales bacterium]